MSNIFKLNNRFSVLNDDSSENVVKNKKRPEMEKYNRNESYNSKLKEGRNKIKELNLSMESFPALPERHILDSKKMNNSMNFLDKMKNNTTSEKNELKLDTEYDNLKPGWLLIKKDPITNKIVHKYKKGNCNNEKYLEKELSNDLINNNRIINTLVDLYYKRREEYIELWGYDDWEKMFQFPNYDYEYFEKLDELFEEELLQELSDEEEIY
jgi:hypothetical protein